MYFIKRIEVKGLWGTRSISLKLNRDINIITGRNGTGKTTFIDLISAALTLDIYRLCKIKFDEIKIYFYPKLGTATPLIIVEKCLVEDGNVQLHYKIQNKIAERKERTLVFDEKFNRIRFSPSKELVILGKENIQKEMNELAKVIWLSIERKGTSSNEMYSFEDRKLSRKEYSNVDIRIAELEEYFIRYELDLKNKETDEQHEFQKEFFLSIFNIPDWQKMFKVIGTPNVSEVKESMIDIYKKFNVLDKSSSGKLDKFIGKIDSSLKKRADSEKNYIEINDALLFSFYWNILMIKERWSETQNKIQEIYRKKHLFLDTINGLMHYKEIISASGKLFAVTKSGTHIKMRELSSGEKQMFILLAEPFLFGSAPVVYIADEPELSLHVEWQESLISNIRKVNSTVQIIFATHSPDIVSQYGDRVFDMEELLGE